MCEYRGARVETQMVRAQELVESLARNGYVIVRAVRDGSARDERARQIDPDGVRDDCTFVHIMLAPEAENRNAKEFATFVAPIIAKIDAQHDGRATRVVMISRTTLSAQLAKTTTDVIGKHARGSELECLSYDRFAIVVPEHALVPRHTIAPRAEIAAFCAKRYDSVETLPRMCASEHDGFIDPMAVWLDLRPGMIMRIERPSETGIYEIAYRRCV